MVDKLVGHAIEKNLLMNINKLTCYL